MQKAMGQENEKKPVVLYVDDIQANLMLFEASFEDTYSVLLAESGTEALELLNTEEIHVLISDQNMPGMTGNELLEKVTSDFPDVMRFMITAYTDYETVVNAINQGHLYGFFNKPYNIDEVKSSINKSLEVRDLRLKNREMILKLEKANETLLSLDRSKTKFLANVTEEIRIPISKIMTAVHMIKDKVDSNELSELLQLLDVSVSKLELFSESTRHLVELNNPDFKLNPIPVSLKEIVEVGIIERGNTLNNDRKSVRLDQKSSDKRVTGEYDLIQASFSSILGYVIDHTNPGTEIVIEIGSRSHNSFLEISSGAYLISEKVKKDLLSISEISTSRFDKDLSLEIVLAKEIMQTHQGELSFFVNNDRCGFTMSFPDKFNPDKELDE